MNRIFSSFILSAVVFVLTSCNQSPLLNHAVAQEPRVTASNDDSNSEINSESEPKEIVCPIKFEWNNICAAITWVTGPQEDDASAFTLKFFSPTTGEAQNPSGVVLVKLWMPDMGHGSSPTKVDPSKNANGDVVTGSFDVTNVNFIMGGLWEVRIRLKAADGSEEVRQIEVNL